MIKSLIKNNINYLIRLNYLMNSFYYPTPEKIIEYNLLMLSVLKIKKADKHELLSYQKLKTIIESCKAKEGDTYDKAVSLLKGLIQGHVFASGNRRTAFISVKDFVISNKERFRIKDHALQAKIMTGIREGYYEDNEIKEWIKNGKIREFKR